MDFTRFKIDLVEKIQLLLEEKERVIIGISGICGSGKSTLASSLLAYLQETGIKSEIVPMDGYHYTKAQLSGMDNPSEAHKRRGAHWTFDGTSFVELVKSIKNQNRSILYANGWSHTKGDPLFNSISIDHSLQVLIIEGLYLFLDLPPWIDLDFDLSIWIDVSLETAMGRLVQRHIDSGLSRDEEEAKRRMEDNDILNAKFLLQKKRQIPGLLIFNN